MLIEAGVDGDSAVAEDAREGLIIKPTDLPASAPRSMERWW